MLPGQRGTMFLRNGSVSDGIVVSGAAIHLGRGGIVGAAGRVGRDEHGEQVVVADDVPDAGRSASCLRPSYRRRIALHHYCATALDSGPPHSIDANISDLEANPIHLLRKPAKCRVQDGQKFDIADVLRFGRRVVTWRGIVAGNR